MAKTFENLWDILPNWAKEDVEQSLAEAVTMSEKQEERKTRFFVENYLKNILRTVAVQGD